MTAPLTPLTDGQRRFLDGARADAAALRSSPSFPAADVDRIERAAERCRAGQGAGDLRLAVARVERCSRMDVDVPTASRLPLTRLVKVAVKRTVGWYLRFLGQRITALGRAVAALGTALSDRVERLEERVEALERRLDGDR